MPEGEDLKNHALNTSHDFYALLEIPDTAQPQEIRRGYRKAAPRYHPDKVGNNPEALEKFYLVQIAYDVLSDPAVKELYDNARRAKVVKAERDAAFEGRRKAMKEDLERRESGAAKRKREEVDAEEQFTRELRRLAEDGKRRRKEREEMLRREAQEEETKDSDSVTEKKPSPDTSNPSDISRSISLRYPLQDNPESPSKSELQTLFEVFGPIDEILLKEKKLKPEGQKHRKAYMTAIIIYSSVVGAHAAISDFPARARTDAKTYSMFESVDWVGGREPDCVPKVPGGGGRFDPDRVALRTEEEAGENNRGAPTFGSFKAGKAAARIGGTGGASLDEVTMMRLKNAERRRMEEKIRKEEATTSAAETGVDDE